MKKFIVGVFVGAILFGGSSVLASSVKSIMDAKVTGLYIVEQGGKKIADGGVINGSAYVPIRAIADATGTSFTIEGKKIILENKLNLNEGGALSEENTDRMSQIAKLKGLIITNRNTISAEKGNITRYEEAITEDEAREEKVPGYQEGVRANIEKCRERIADYEAKIIAAEAEIARIQAEIDATK